MLLDTAITEIYLHENGLWEQYNFANYVGYGQEMRIETR